MRCSSILFGPSSWDAAGCCFFSIRLDRSMHSQRFVWSCHWSVGISGGEMRRILVLFLSDRFFRRLYWT